MSIKVNGGVLVPNASNVQPDVLKMLVKLDPMRTPLLDWLILSNKNSKPVINPYGKFEWFRRAFVPHTFTVGASNISGSSGVWNITAGSMAGGNTDIIGVLQVGDLVLCKISGGYHILKVASNNGTTVVLNLTDSTQQSGIQNSAIEANSTIRTMGQLLYDGHGRLNYVSVQEENVYNYLKEFAYYVETTGRQQAGEYFTDGMSHAERVAQKFIEAKLEIERYLWFATLRSALSSGNNQATLGYGLDSQITTATVYSSAMVEATWRNVLKQAMKYGSGKKIAYLGADLIDNVEGFMQDYYEVTQSGASSLFNEIGLSAKTYRTFGGIVTLVWNPLFDEDRAGNGYILDEEQVVLRYMADDERGSRKLRVRDNVGIGYEDKKVTEILADVGVMIKDERTCHKIIKA